MGNSYDLHSISKPAALKKNMKQIKDYSVAIATSSVTLADQVKYLILQGYVPQGGIFATSDSCGYGHTFYQAMVLYAQ